MYNLDSEHDEINEFTFFEMAALGADIISSVQRLLVRCIVLGLIFFGAGEFELRATITFKILLALFILYSVISILRPPIEHFFRSYKLDSQGLHYRHGILLRKYDIVPRNRVQHADISQGFVQRQYNLATLTVYTAGSGSFTHSIPHLRKQEAERIMRELIDG